VWSLAAGDSEVALPMRNTEQRSAAKVATQLTSEEFLQLAKLQSPRCRS
jgi:hypothetical protein